MFLTAVLLSYLKGWSQTNDSTLVSIPVEYVRLANAKLIEHRYCNILMAQKDSIIGLQDLQYSIADSLYRVQLQKNYQSVVNLQKQVEKQKKKIKILTSTAAGCAGLFVLMLIVK